VSFSYAKEAKRPIPSESIRKEMKIYFFLEEGKGGASFNLCNGGSFKGRMPSTVGKD